jgi:hypothetical protein
MPNFAFDESKGIEENLEAFFSHLVGDNEEFAAHLKAELPTVVGDGFNRAVFNRGVVEMLDDESESEGQES